MMSAKSLRDNLALKFHEMEYMTGDADLQTKMEEVETWVAEQFSALETERLRLTNWGKEMIRKHQGQAKEIAKLRGEPWPPKYEATP